MMRQGAAKAVVAAVTVIAVGAWCVATTSSWAAPPPNAPAQGASSSNLAQGASNANPAQGASNANPAASDIVSRGAYLAILGDCAACHTAHDGQKFAGGRYMETPFGPISTPNITPDKKTGIGNITDDQFYRVFHDGIGMEGEHLYPVMPFPWYTRVTRDDVLAIKAYLFSLPPVHNPRPPNKLAFPFNVRAGLMAWDALFLNKGTFKPDPSKSAEVNRGAYIVQGLGHCGECHNGRNLLGDTRLADQLQGGPIQDWYAPNITNSAQNGIGKYSDDQLFSFLKHGVAPGMGVVAGPMAETVHESLSKFTNEDLHAVIAYLRSVPGTSAYQPKTRTAFTGKRPLGETEYLNNCASCHQLDGKGIAGQVPSLAGNGAVLAKGPETIIRVILAGLEAQGDYAPMPAVGHDLTDRQIADVANYIRQSWGNKAPPNAGPGLVGKLRPHTFTVMNIGPDGHCPTLVDPTLTGVINDPKNGIRDALQAMTLDNVMQTAEAVVKKVKAAAPSAKRADIVNSLTIAYCPVVVQDKKLQEPSKVAMLDTFSERVYSELLAGGKE